MSQQRDLPESMAWRVIDRLESGQTQRSVADAVGVARSVVARLWNRFQETGNVRRLPGTGRPRATTSTDDRYIQLTARRNRTENATHLQRQLLLATGRRVSSQTVRNRLHEGGLYARRPMVCIPLTPRHRAARRRWAAEHRDWKQHDWSQELFTDEYRFSLECDTRRVLVWRDMGTRNNPAFVRERTATAGSDVVQSGSPIFDDFFQHLWPYIGNNTANVVFQMETRMERLGRKLCCAVLLEPQLLDIMIVQFSNEKVSNHGSIPITIDCNVLAFIVFEEVRTNDSTSP
ncbi:HTH_Tnp_Tc3_2 domain-containing protein [Trichonephila clavipes]|nr:HTH_Tnp_Tc3_2 domain-containing protein [Trichonephila clavipes]